MNEGAMFYPVLRHGSCVELSESESLRNQLAKAVTCIYQKYEG